MSEKVNIKYFGMNEVHVDVDCLETFLPIQFAKLPLSQING
jgi:hypothetical protein